MMKREFQKRTGNSIKVVTVIACVGFFLMAKRGIAKAIDRVTQ